VKDPVLMSMTPGALRAFLNDAGCATDITVKFIQLLQEKGTPPCFESDKEIPDEAPASIKNFLALGKGKTFRIGLESDDPEHGTFLRWYQSNNEKLIVVWQFQHPVRLIADDD
jgi:hypothetical protein